jgi:hypothetical protein
MVAVACVGQDMIKVWPLPVETPWREDVKAGGDAAEPDRRLPGGDAVAPGHAFRDCHPMELHRTIFDLDANPPPYAADFMDIEG